MKTYKVVKNNDGLPQSIVRDDGASIPICGGNSDYQQYLDDVAANGDYPVEIIPNPEPAGKSIDEQLADIRAAIFELEGI